ncbi:Hsp20/alpha crystallin family protein [Actinobacteria bacterium YIM 96077]|uniref:Hsp20/alpha crystallin family protein n=1 Tax=Phytoactinopolyspora halophila TaxID=1981511 RepID=A0A329R0V1_9ACTN|nr:Hsp20/alpha crystallin family protein [Actinobacteria bacterium YIM 96077]RAW18167.1 Hsp20/alpha crystallin family protein [Phytoactinopolyspora halophila]
MTRFDPFREMDRLAEQLLGSARNVATMPMDLYREQDRYVMHFDLPGVDPGSIDVNIEGRSLTVKAHRTGRSEENVQWLARERPVGTYARQLNLGDGLSPDQIDATYADGVLTLTIPVAEEAKPRRIDVTRVDSTQSVGSGSSERQEIQT